MRQEPYEDRLPHQGPGECGIGKTGFRGHGDEWIEVDDRDANRYAAETQPSRKRPAGPAAVTTKAVTLTIPLTTSNAKLLVAAYTETGSPSRI